MNNANWCCFKGCTQTSVTNATTNAPVTITPPTTTTVLSTQATTTQAWCDNKCKGQYPYGCNPSFSLGYCSANGGCSYTGINDPNWCCFKGCSSQSSATITQVTVSSTTTTTRLTSQASCDSKCTGGFPYGCNPSFSIVYCHSNGGCSYAPVSGPSWCCAKGC